MKTIFIVLDHGLAMAYFFETELVRLLLNQNIRLVIILPEQMLSCVKKEYMHPGVIFESLRDTKIQDYVTNHMPRVQSTINYIRRAVADSKIPLTYVDTHRRRHEYEARGRHKILLLMLRPVIFSLRKSRFARKIYRYIVEKLFTSRIYDDLFEKYQPDLIISNTAGWRSDKYLLREAHRLEIPSTTVIVGWDHPSSQGLPGASIDFINVWSEIHKKELVDGVDWQKEKVHIGGMPLYDGYLSKKWIIQRDSYYEMHELDPNKKLVSFVATALSISPNLHILELLADLINHNKLGMPSQLLIRLHPNHFKHFPHYSNEKKEIYELANKFPDVHIVEPKEISEGLERYSGEDFPEKASMLFYSDVLVTVYSTMVVESAVHDTPFISACIDAPKGWDNKFWIPLSQVPNWPTALRVNQIKAGRTVLTPEDLRHSLIEYIENPRLDHKERQNFIQQELTFMNGEATKHTAEFLLSLIKTV